MRSKKVRSTPLDTDSHLKSNPKKCKSIQMNDKKKDKSLAKKESMNETIDPQLNYTPKLFVRCHCRRNDPFDNSTNIWSAAFMPNPSGSEGNGYVATCGANMVCIIDCKKSIESDVSPVMARYIDANEDEEFASLAWTVMPVTDTADTEALVLAVGGKSSILLMSRLDEFHCYQRIAAHSDQINALLFITNDLLFSASYDETIKLWKISRPKEETSIELLTVIHMKDNLLSLSYSHKYDILFASGHKGLYLWPKPIHLAHLRDSQQNSFSAQIKTKSLIDGLIVIPGDEDSIAVRVYASKMITIVDLKKVTEEMSKTNTKCEPKSIALLKVTKTRLKSFDGFFPFIYLSAENNLLVSGGPDGQIRLYLTDHLSAKSTETTEADRILEWPLIENITKNNQTIIDDKKPVIVNTVAISPDLQYLIACTQMNLLCIWHKA